MKSGRETDKLNSGLQVRLLGLEPATTVQQNMEGRVRCLGVWLCVWLSVCQVRAHSVPSEMNRTIQNLLDNYVSSHAARHGYFRVQNQLEE